MRTISRRRTGTGSSIQSAISRNITRPRRARRSARRPSIAGCDTRPCARPPGRRTGEDDDCARAARPASGAGCAGLARESRRAAGRGVDPVLASSGVVAMDEVRVERVHRGLVLPQEVHDPLKTVFLVVRIDRESRAVYRSPPISCRRTPRPRRGSRSSSSRPSGRARPSGRNSWRRAEGRATAACCPPRPARRPRGRRRPALGGRRERFGRRYRVDSFGRTRASGRRSVVHRSERPSRARPASERRVEPPRPGVRSSHEVRP